MKSNWKKLIAIPLLAAMAIIPLSAQDNDPLAAQLTNSEAATNSFKTKKHNDEESSDNVPVRIDASGIHVGGPSPVDVNIPGFDPNGMPHGGDFGMPKGAVLIALAGITVPFAFLIIVVVSIVIFKHRRNRMLHETIRAMIDKGVPIPPELIVQPEPKRIRRAASDLRTGVVVLALGLGLTIFFGKLGMIVVFVGIAFLIVWRFEKKDSTNNAGPANT